MNEEDVVQRNIAVGTEFDTYVLGHPELLARIPDGAAVFVLPADDPELCAYNLRLAETSRRTDDEPDRPIVFVHVDGLAPAQTSRLVNPRIEVVEPHVPRTG